MTIYDTSLVITVPADGLAPNGARPSAGTLVTTKLCIIYSFNNLLISILKATAD